MRGEVMISASRAMPGRALAAMLAGTLALPRRGARNSDRRQAQRLRQAGGQSARTAGPRADGGAHRGRISAARPRLSRDVKADEALRSAAKLHLTDNITVYENGAPLPAPRLTARGYPCRPTSRSRRSRGLRESARAAPRRQSRPRLEPAVPRRAARISGPLGSLDFAIHLRVDRFGAQGHTSLRFLPPGGETRAFEFTAIRVCCASIRAGTRRRCASSFPASGTSSKGSITCCFSLPRASVPAVAAAGDHRHRVHGRRTRSRSSQRRSASCPTRCGFRRWSRR